MPKKALKILENIYYTEKRLEFMEMKLIYLRIVQLLMQQLHIEWIKI